MTSPIFRETDANVPAEREERTAVRSSGIGVPEVGFLLGFAAAVAGIALLSVAAALIVAGALLMVASWRSA